MPTFEHFQQIKNEMDLPKHDKVGACLTCSYWQVEEARGKELIGRLALCIQPELETYALIVSGSSACNKWKEKTPIKAEAKAYAKQGEES